MAKKNARLNAKTHLGIKFHLVIPNFAIPHLDLMDNQSIGLAIREALRSAGRPAATILKQLLKGDLAKSDQSTGATERAVIVKYGRNKSNPNRFYCIIGINKKHFEFHTAKIPESFSTKLKRGRKQRGAGLFGLQVRGQRKGVLRSKQVFSRYRNEKRIAKLKGKPLKRRPSKYFHLIDIGFNHRRAGLVIGYKFIERLRTAIGDSLQKTFNERLTKLIIPTMKKEIIRKWKKNVL